MSSLTEALVWAALRHGAELETGRHVQAIRRQPNALEVTADDGATWTARHVVIASGASSGQLEPLDPAAHLVRTGPRSTSATGVEGPSTFAHDWHKDCYVPWRDGTVLVGATVEEVGFDERTTAAGVRDLLDAVCELLPEAWGATFLEARAGLRPATPDSLPILARRHISTAWFT